jgi:hypothetical protein
MQRNFLTYCFLFFVPIVLVYVSVEALTLSIPSAYQINQIRIQNEVTKVETLVLGSSQIMSGVNPEWLSSPTLNLASGNQHHDTDFKLLKALLPELKNLKTVVLEVSYSHFELPHNGKDFWKNSLYLKYYDVNCFERSTYFKDRLIYLSFPEFFSKMIVNYYIDKKPIADFNKFGYNSADVYGQFQALNYDLKAIESMRSFKINTEEHLNTFQNNTTLFIELLDYLQAQDVEVIICTLPMYHSYLEKRNSKILNRRNGILDWAENKYKNVHLLDLEEDINNYVLKDFWNQSHLSPSGAKKFTNSLNTLIQSY